MVSLLESTNKETINTETNKKDNSKYILLLLILLLLLFSGLLYYDFTRLGKEGSNPIIGELVIKNRIVKRKFDGSVVWNNANNGDIVRQKDSILSSNLSDASIKLNDGTEIIMDENTLIVLNISMNNTFEIDFKKGDINIKRNNSSGESKIQLTSGKETVSLNEGDIKLSKNKEEDNLELTVKKGEATLQNDNQIQKIDENQKAKIIDNKVVSKDLSETQLTGPANIENIALDGKESDIEFKWKNPKKKEVELQIAKDRAFRYIIYRSKSTGEMKKVRLKSGKYFWRIVEVKDPSKKTETRKLNLVESEVFSSISPKNKQTFNYLEENPIIEFLWTNISIASYYILEVSNTSNFSNILVSRRTSTISTAIKDLGEGTYFYRIKMLPSLKNLKERYTQPKTFTIKKSKTYNVPSLKIPTDNYRISEKVFINKGLLFSWKSEGRPIDHYIEISKSPSFSQVIYTDRAISNYIKIKNKLSNGTYFWRIKANYSESKSITSVHRTFSILKESVQPIIIQPNHNEVFSEGSSIYLRWKSEEASTFKLELASDPNFKKIYRQIQSNQPFYKINVLPSGEYYIRIQSENSRKYSKPVRFLVQFEAAPPVLEYPILNSKLNLKLGTPLIFRWSNTKEAESYLLSLYKNGKRIFAQNIRGKSYFWNFPKGTELGAYEWKMKAIYKDNRISEDKLSKFNIQTIKEIFDIPKFDGPDTIYIDEK